MENSNQNYIHKRFFELSLELIFIADFHGYFRYANPSLEKFLGYSTEELLAKDFVEHIHPNDLKKTEKILFNLSKGRNTLVFENRYICKDGSIKNIKWTATPIIEEGIIYGIGKEITEQSLTENNKYENDISYSDLFKTMSVNFMLNELIIDDNGKVIDHYYRDVNPAFTKLVGKLRNEIINKRGKELFKIDDYWLDIFEKVNKTGDPITYQSLSSEMNRYYTIHAWKVKEGLIAVAFSDINEQKEVENKLIKSKEKAEESDRLKLAFLANMSHEIRTPMNGILGFTDLLKEKKVSGEDQLKFIDIIEKSSNRMLNTINNIVDIAKIESGQVKISISKINLNELLDELLDFFLPEARKNKLSISYTKEVSNKRAIFKSDKEKINSILTNLIKNAIRFSTSGHVDFGYHINEDNKKKEIEFFVFDTGIGIPLKRQEAIFNHFVKADIEDVQAFEGSGLGLSISKAYVEMLGGKIWVESKEGVGSKFYFTVPYHMENSINEENDEVSSKAELSITKQLKILIADDDEVGVAFLIEVLKTHAKELLIANTGKEAVKICKENPDIDLILMDIKMPEMNGYEATKQIRAFNKNVYIISQTAFAQVGDREKSLKAGCNNYISKPIVKEKLLELISNHF